MKPEAQSSTKMPGAANTARSSNVRGMYWSARSSVQPDRLIAARVDDRGAVQFALVLVGGKRRGAVHGAAVVPDDEVADPPLVHVDEARLRGELHQLVEQRPALVARPADDVRGMRGDEQRGAARARMPPPQRMMPRRPRRALFL